MSSTDPQNDGLLPQHAEMLADSAIAPEIVAGRGYRSIETKAELKRLGFSDVQCRTPALLVPIRTALGEITSYQIRPDVPRIKKGKAIKYESLAGRRMVLDVPTAAAERLRDPNFPLWITEGAKKVDSATSAGLCCIGLLGVWNWRGTNVSGGLTALADWESIALKGSNGTRRRVYIAFDSDAVTKRSVHQALQRLKQFLESRGADVWIVYLPGDASAHKTGLDDYLAEGHAVDDLVALASPELRYLEPAAEGGHLAEAYPYRERDDGIYLVKQNRDGEFEHQLTNFRARITAEITRDDGVDATRALEIEAHVGDRCKRVLLPSAKFAAMNWPVDELGTAAVVTAGFGSKDHSRAAIQLLSRDVVQRRVFTHTGWREIDRMWVYLHAGGAIGPIGPVPGMEVELPRELERYQLPDPPNGTSLTRAIRSTFGLLEVAPKHVMVPLLAAVVRAAVGAADFSVSLTGPSGEGKTELAALCAQHYGAGLTRLNLVSWSSTGNALEGLAFHAKDALFVVDDFAPGGSANDVARLHREADRFLRAQGNQSGRSRMSADSSIRAAKPPRGLTLSTGEDVPRGHSLRARSLVLELGAGDVDWDRLTLCQRAAADGSYAACLAGFIKWQASRRDRLPKLKKRIAERLRDSAHRAQWHRRTATMVGELGAGLRLFLRFVVDAGVLSPQEMRAMWADSWAALGEAAVRHGSHVHASDPVARFRELLLSVLASGEGHVASSTGQVPQENATTWGWRKRSVAGNETLWTEVGKRLGWVDERDLYLDVDAAHRAVNAAAGPSGEGVSVSAKTLAKRLQERGLLLSTESGRGHLKVRRVVDGKRRDVLHLDVAWLYPIQEPAQSAQSAQSAHEKSTGSDAVEADGPIGPVLEPKEPDSHGHVVERIA